MRNVAEIVRQVIKDGWRNRETWRLKFHVADIVGTPLHNPLFHAYKTMN